MAASSVVSVFGYRKYVQSKKNEDVVASYNNYVFDGETYYTNLDEAGSQQIEICITGKVNPKYPIYSYL